MKYTKNIAIGVLALLLILTALKWRSEISGAEMMRGIADRERLKEDSLLSLKLSIDRELRLANEDISKLKGLNTGLDMAVKDARREIVLRQQKIDRLSREANTTAGLRKQLTEAKTFRKNCEDKVNTLLQDNQRLLSRLDEVNVRNGKLETEIQRLNEKLEQGKTLHVQITSLQYFKLKKDRSTIPVTKLRKAKRVTVTAEVAENQLADAGERRIYLVITSPDGKVLGAEGNKFNNQKLKRESRFSQLKILNYENKAETVKLNYDFDKKPKKGNYRFEIFIDGNYAGKQELIL
jgi:hypothetical protein